MNTDISTPGPDTHRTHHDWESSDPVHVDVIRAVAAVSGKQPSNLDPLYDTIDPGALSRLLESAQRNGHPTEIGVSFEYAGYDVRVDGDGEITVRKTRSPDR